MKKIIPAVLVVIIIVVVAILVMLNNSKKETIIDTSGEIIEKIENASGEDYNVEEVEYNPQYDTLDEYLNDKMWLTKKFYIPDYIVPSYVYMPNGFEHEDLTQPQQLFYVKASDNVAVVKVHILEEQGRDKYYIVGLDNGKIRTAQIPEDFDCFEKPEDEYESFNVNIELYYDKSNNVFKYSLVSEGYYYEAVFALNGFNINIINEKNSEHIILNSENVKYDFEDIDINQCEIENPKTFKISKEGYYLGDDFEGKYFWDYERIRNNLEDTLWRNYKKEEITNERDRLKDLASSIIKRKDGFLYEYNGVIDGAMEDGGEGAGWIEQKTSYSYLLPVNDDNKIEYKFATILNISSYYLKDLVAFGKDSNTYKTYKEIIAKYKNGTYGNEEEQEFYKNFDFEKYMQDIANDKNFDDLRKRVKKDEEGVTEGEILFEEDAYFTAVYSALFQYMPPIIYIPEDDSLIWPPRNDISPAAVIPKYTLSSITFMNGKSDSINDYYNNARAKKIKIKINDFEKEYLLEDTPEYQNIQIDWTSKGDEYQKPVTVSIEVLEKYDGDITDDVYFSGIYINKDQNFVSFAI